MIYLDNAATTKIDPAVLDTMMPYLTEEYGNAGTKYEFGRRAADAVDKARKQVADLIGAKPEQIIFTSGGSEANNLAIQGVMKGRSQKENGYMLTTQFEHSSVFRTAISTGKAKIISDPGVFNSARLYEWLESYHKNCGLMLVSMMYTNNETGDKFPVETVASYCEDNGILFHIDAVQALGNSRIDVKKLRCDFLSISSHKIHGPKGIGALYVKDKSLLSPIIYGGSAQEFGIRGGTENVAGIVGFGKACSMIQENFAEYTEHTVELWCKFVNAINEMLGETVRINGVPAPGKIINMSFDGVSGEALLLMLDKVGICASAGSACTSHEVKPSQALKAYGYDDDRINSSVRFSFSRMNTFGEAQEAASRVTECIGILRSMN